MGAAILDLLTSTGLDGDASWACCRRWTAGGDVALRQPHRQGGFSLNWQLDERGARLRMQVGISLFLLHSLIDFFSLKPGR
jgi:hypothetical protein